MTVFPMESAPYQNEVYDALQQGLDQLTVRIFKAIPPECIDIITQMVMELPKGASSFVAGKGRSDKFAKRVIPAFSL